MRTVLIVEDDHDEREAATAAFKNAGWHVHSTETGRSAVDVAGRMTFDAIVADLRLPDMCGIDVLTGLSDQSITPFVIVTAFGTIQDAVDAMKSGAADFVQKPIPPADLVRIAIRSIEARAHPRFTAATIERFGVTDRRVNEVLRIIHTEYADRALTLGSTAPRLRISRFFLTRLVKRETGHTFTYHLHRRRTYEAEQLLLTSSLSIKEIAARVGYASTYDLDRHFTLFYQTTPSVFLWQPIRLLSRLRRLLSALASSRTIGRCTTPSLIIQTS